MSQEILKHLYEETAKRSRAISFHIEQLNLEHEKMKHLDEQIKYHEAKLELESASLQPEAATPQPLEFTDSPERQQPGQKIAKPLSGSPKKRKAKKTKK